MATDTNQGSGDAGPNSGSDDITKDLEQLSELATLVTSARDAMSDDIVTRVSSAFSEGISLLDRLTRNEGLMRLVLSLDRPENQRLLASLADALTATSRDLAQGSPAKGGIGGLLQLARDPGTQEGLRILSVLGQHWGKNMRDSDQRDG